VLGPYRDVLGIQCGVCIFRLVEGRDNRARHVTRDSYSCSRRKLGRIEKLFLKRDEPAFGRSPFPPRLQIAVERQLQDFDACTLFESFRGKHFTAQDNRVSTILVRRLLELDKGNGVIHLGL